MKTLFPQWFKFIGYGLPIMFIGSLAIIKGVSPETMEALKASLSHPKEIVFAVFNIGLLLVALSKDKIEDERTHQLRFDAISFAFLFGVSQVLFHSLGIWETAEYGRSAYIMALMLGVYLLSFETRKRFWA